MKKILLFLFCIFYMHGYAQDKACITFLNNDNKYDFGGIPQGDIPSYQMEIRNTGAEALIISNITSENNDLKFQWPKKNLKPGKKGLIVVTYDPKDPAATGSFKNDVFITSNATSSPYPFIHVSGTVVPSKGESSSKSSGKQSSRGGRGR